MRTYKINADDDHPHIAIIDPRTGAKLVTLTVCTYTSLYSSPPSVTNIRCLFAATHKIKMSSSTSPTLSSSSSPPSSSSSSSPSSSPSSSSSHCHHYPHQHYHHHHYFHHHHHQPRHHYHRHPHNHHDTDASLIITILLYS